MRLYNNQPYTHAQVRAEASALKLWRTLARQTVSVRKEGTTYHLGRGTHALATSEGMVTVPLRSLGGTLCHCLVHSMAPSYTWSPSVRDGFFSLVVHRLGLQAQLKEYQERPTAALRRSVLEFMEPSSVANKNSGFNSRTMNYVGWTPVQREELTRAAQEVVDVDHVSARAVLESSAYTAKPRVAALRKFVQSTWLRYVPRDERELLVGTFDIHLKENHYTIGLLKDVLDTSIVHRHPAEGLVFFRLPAFAYEYLLRTVDDEGLRLQAAPWDETLSLAEVATLWDPYNQDAFCSLERSCEALRLV